MQKFREKVNVAIASATWRLLKMLARPIRAAEPSLVLAPCDPGSPIGSRGDEAMIYAVLQNFRKRHPGGRISVICVNPECSSSDDGERLRRDFPGLEFVPVWHGQMFLLRVFNAMRMSRASEVYVIGADCMDGFYSSLISLGLLAAADLACRMGAKTRITGFSFNENPAPAVVGAFMRTTPKLEFNLRDQVSLDGFTARFGVGSLVADTAFCLEPNYSPRVKTILDEMEAERAKGKFVLGFNLNPLLKMDARPVDEALGRLENVSIWLVPHDYRRGGDLEVLARLHHGRLVRDVLSAAELKALTSGLDALWTSRMHLGIAALGMGKPIGAFAYQGKFAGLYRHFGLDERFLVNPASPGNMVELIAGFVNSAREQSITVRQSLAKVRELAQKNL